MNIDLILGAAGIALFPILVVVFRYLIKQGWIGIDRQIKALTKDPSLRSAVYVIIRQVEAELKKESTEEKLKEIVNEAKKIIPGKLDDMIIEALVTALYEELRG